MGRETRRENFLTCCSTLLHKKAKALARTFSKCGAEKSEFDIMTFSHFYLENSKTWTYLEFSSSEDTNLFNGESPGSSSVVHCEEE